MRSTIETARLMDGIYRGQRHIYDATRKFYLLGRDEMIDDLAMAPGEAVLEIGCGTGRNLVKIARTYPGADCYGIDVSGAMLATARSALARAGLQQRVALAQADATEFQPMAVLGRDTFDRVVVSYALSMIPPWREVLRHLPSLLAPSGSLHLVDFGDQAGLPTPFAAVLARWLALFHVAPRPTLAQDLQTLAASSHMRVRVRSSYRGYAVIARLDRAA